MVSSRNITSSWLQQMSLNKTKANVHEKKGENEIKKNIYHIREKLR